MICETTSEVRLPYGTNDLEPRVMCVSDSPRRVRCYVRDCRHILRTPTRYEDGEICPDHGTGTGNWSHASKTSRVSKISPSQRPKPCSLTVTSSPN